MSRSENTTPDDVDELCGLLDAALDISVNDPQHLSRNTYFVVNSIAYVPPLQDDADSSGEEPESDFELVDYRPYEDPPRKPVVPVVRPERLNTRSRVVMPFLERLCETGLEVNDEKDMAVRDIAAVAVLLNRMQSISTRRNHSLASELQCDTSDSEIRHEVIAAYWTCKWHVEGSKTEVDYPTVRRYYKKLKKRSPREAEKLLSREASVKVPYRLLRETLKNHNRTRGLVTDCRKRNKDANIYLAFFDNDAVDFNGVLSSYLRKVATCERTPPEVMTTGYEFPMDREYGPFFKMGSKIDRDIRVILANVHPLLPYYREPNLCVLVKPLEDTVTASFEPNDTNQVAESPALLKNLQAAGYKRFTFFRGNALVTAIPLRARTFGGNPLNYSANSINRNKTDEEEFSYYQCLCQSHFKPHTRYGIFFANFTGRKPDIPKCREVLAALRQCYEKAEGDEEDYLERAEDPLNDLINLQVPNWLAGYIAKAMFNVLQYLSRTRASYSRTNATKFANFLADKETVFAELIDFDDLDEETYANLPSLLNAFRELAPRNGDFIMTDWASYGKKDLIKAQATNPDFPKLMKDHPTVVVYENSEDHKILRYWFRNFGRMIDFEAVINALEREGDIGVDAFRELWQHICPNNAASENNDDEAWEAWYYGTH